MADKRVSTDFIVDEKGNAEDVRKPKTRIKLTDKHFAKLPNGKDSVWATDGFSFDEAEKSLRKEAVDAADINVKVTVEVSEAITGLKALQREAKAATKALAELRDYMEATGGVTLKNGAEVAQSLRALFDRLDEEPTVYLDGKEIGKASGKGVRR
ncbi:hypothetical protein R7M47_05160 [Bacillus inaquosorum]|uniref:hypothetical protein n=1 Tax=Bacillus inaquosorum TaxID=483913 RepID=UPI00389AEA31